MHNLDKNILFANNGVESESTKDINKLFIFGLGYVGSAVAFEMVNNGWKVLLLLHFKNNIIFVIQYLR